MEIDMELFEKIMHFGMTHKTLIVGFIVNVILILFINKSLDILSNKTREKLQKYKSDSPLLRLLPIAIKVIKVLIIFVLVASFLQTNGYSVTSLIAGLGIVGMAVGFAAKEAIANVFGSFELITDRVYSVGDYIQFNGIEGTVMDINFRSTKIMTMNNFLINIPNNIIANTAVLNMTTIPCRRIDMFIGIEYSTSNEKISRAVDILKQVCVDNPMVEDNALAFVSELDASQITLRLYVNTKTKNWAEFVEIKSEVIKEIVKRYREEDISFAFPSQSLYVQNVNNEN